MNALRLSLWLDDDPGERHPIRQDLPACCARAATDQVAAVPARSVMNVRLRMSASISGDAIIAAQTRALIRPKPMNRRDGGLRLRLQPALRTRFMPQAASSRHRDRICPQSPCPADQ